MIRPFYPLFLLCFLQFACSKPDQPDFVVVSDIDHFWEAYDSISTTPDSLQQARYLKELFLDRGSPGLEGIMQARSYTTQEYLNAIRSYPKFWNSVRENTGKAGELSRELDAGIEKLRKLYPPLKPAKIYFTIGALRTNGTTLDSLVLIGSELAMADKNTVSSEFPEPYATGRRRFFDSNPIEDLILLNVHEYVHTQQKPIVHNLLSQCLYEGVAEFVSVTAMGVPSAAPAIAFGKENEERVRKKFEEDMFKMNNTYDWLWSDRKNEFDMRDLGYYIGYEICERFYQKAEDKQQAIKTMIELDYENEEQIEAFVNGSGFFSASLEELYQNFDSRRPQVTAIGPFENGAQDVSPSNRQLELYFSTEMDPAFRNFDFGPLGEEAAVRIQNVLGYGEGNRSIQLEIAPLLPDKQYQITIGSGFRDTSGMPLKPYLIDFKTASD